MMLNEVAKRFNPLSPNCDENEISLYIFITCSKHSSDEKKESDQQG